jgi:subtilisin family serine protease
MGKIVVAAIPETAQASGDAFPATIPGVLAVASAELPPPVGSVREPLFAPGRNVLTLRPGGGYDFENGSSMAAANVSGIAALVMSLRPKLGIADLARLLHDAMGAPTPAGTPAAPVVNACRAVAALAVSGNCSDLRSMHATRR